MGCAGAVVLERVVAVVLERVVAVVLEQAGVDVFDNAGVLATELHPLHSDDSSRSLILQHHQEVCSETKR